MKRFLLNLERAPDRTPPGPADLPGREPFGHGATARVPNGFIHRGTHIVAGYRRQAEVVRALSAEFLEAVQGAVIPVRHRKPVSRILRSILRSGTATTICSE